MTLRDAIILIAVAGTAAAAQSPDRPYAGEDSREIAALSPEQAAGLRAGAGLGYARSAELNGWPGPLHVLELSDALGLSAEVRAAVEAVRAEMLAEVKPLGAALIAAEAGLDALFSDGTPSGAAVSAAVERASGIEARLRGAHLRAHLRVAPLLTRHQRITYAALRGYGDAGGGHAQH